MKLQSRFECRRAPRRVGMLYSPLPPRKLTGLIPSTLLALFAGGAAFAADVTSVWNVASGNWGLATNWNPSANFPDNGALTYDAVLGNNGSITLDRNITIQKYTQSSGTITGSSIFSLTVNELTTWTGGTIGGNGTLVANGGIELSGTSNKVLGNGSNTARTLINNGTINMSGGESADLLLSSSGGANPGSAFMNNGTFNVSDGADIQFNNFGGSAASFTNSATGIFNKTGAGTSTQVGVAYNNNGATNVTSGTLQLAGGGASNGGTYAVVLGADLEFNGGTHALNTTSAITGAGNVNFVSETVDHSGAYTITGVTTISGGTVNFLNAAPISIPTLTFSLGTLAGSGAVNVTNATWTGGRMGGNGTTAISGTLTLSGTGIKTLGNGGNTGRTLINNGTTNMSGGENADLVLASSGGVIPGSALVNNGTFNVSDAADLQFSNFGGSAPSFTNAATGIFNKTGAGTSTQVSVAYNNNGTANVTSGTLELTGGGANDGGIYAVALGADLVFNGGTHALNAASSITGAGNVNFVSETVDHSGAYTITGVTTISGGTVNFLNAAPVSIPTLTFSSGTLAGSGVVNVTNATWTGGRMGGNGTTTISGTLTLSGTGIKTLGIGGNAGRTLINNGIVNMGGGENADLLISTSGGVNPGSVFTNNGTFNISDAADLQSNNFGGNAANFTNSATGIFNKTGAGTSTQVAIAFNNNGTTNVTSGTLELTGGGASNGGNLSVASGADLVFNGGTHTLNATSAISGAGNVIFDSETVDHSGAYTITGVTTITGGTINFLSATPVSIPSLTFISGALAGNGVVNVTNGTWSGGTMAGNGTTTISDTLTLSGTGIKILGNGGNAGRTLINNGIVNMSGGENADLLVSTSGGVNPGSVVTNNGTFSISDAADLQSNNFGGGASSFTNSATGVFNKTGAGTPTQVSITFNNNGTTNVTSGTLELSGGGASNGGTLTVASGADLQFTGGTHSLNATSAISGAGNVTFTSGTVDLSGAYTVTGATTINGGTANFLRATPVSIPSLTFSSGTLAGSGVVNVTNATWSGGTMAANGTTTISGTLALSGTGIKILGNGGNAARTFINNGTVNMSGGENADLLLSSSGGVNPGSVFTNNGTFNISDGADLQFNNFGGGASSFTNSATGIFNKSGDTTITQISVAYNNAGTVNVNSGTLEFTGQFTQTAGSLNLIGGSVSGSVALNLEGGLLTGNGVIANSLANLGGTISPGTSAGFIDITSNLTLGNNSNLSIELGGVTQATQYDFVREAGALALTLDGTLTVNFINGFQTAVNASNTFTVLTSNQPLLGAFDNAANGARISVANLPGTFQINYGASSPFGAESVVLSAFVIPEPTVAFSLLGGLGSICLRRRR